ncbi:uncharacterized protein ASCRUDRAFT_157058 [Ascoidea rubescens DSM 1968]|uniref:Uncharacterized protein n=1 Tax=Ascoidea rubescens DSM 1968 TaxID=1344418 RepID=A0A1D2VF84_9ASCO|nr:hypothetical protein ASCRUDRAFT_157058 [Ascoidea rubescens DSM 1968]ODV60173.1 hypothetical protein ASCRUDRAFT_157058 [Ascoidea rubescens DSM 1968]
MKTAILVLLAISGCLSNAAEQLVGDTIHPKYSVNGPLISKREDTVGEDGTIDEDGIAHYNGDSIKPLPGSVLHVVPAILKRDEGISEDEDEDGDIDEYGIAHYNGDSIKPLPGSVLHVGSTIFKRAENEGNATFCDLSDACIDYINYLAVSSCLNYDESSTEYYSCLCDLEDDFWSVFYQCAYCTDSVDDHTRNYIKTEFCTYNVLLGSNSLNPTSTSIASASASAASTTVSDSDSESSASDSSNSSGGTSTLTLSRSSSASIAEADESSAESLESSAEETASVTGGSSVNGAAFATFNGLNSSLLTLLVSLALAIV